MDISHITRKLKGVKRSREGFVAKCPAHDDKKQSLCIDDTGGKVLLKCFAGCPPADIVEAMGIEWKDLFCDGPRPGTVRRSFSQDGVRYFASPQSKIAAVYRYTDETGRVLYENVRFEPKDFRQRRIDERGTVDWSLKGVTRVPYRLVQLAASKGAEIWLCEGEKDADNLAELGFTTSSFKNWSSQFNQYIKGADVVIVRDHDVPGGVLADEAARLISPAAASVKVVDPFAEYELPEKQGPDISDYIKLCVRDEGMTREEIAERLSLMAEGAPRWVERNPSRNLFIVKTGNQWLDEAKGRVSPKMLFGEFWFQNELCILFADTNVGKSILAVQIGDAISRGRQVAGSQLPVASEEGSGLTTDNRQLTTECEAQRVVYFDFELTDKQFESRLAIRQPGADVHTDHYRFSDNFCRAEVDPETSDLNGFKTFEDFLNDSLERTVVEQKADVLIIDNLTYLKDETENSRNALPLMKYLKELKQRHRISILALAHTPKRDSTKPLGRNDLQGSKMLINFCDSSFAIGESHKEPGTRYLKQIKARNTGLIYHSENVLLARIERVGSLLQFIFTGTGSEYDHLKVKSATEKEQQKAETLAQIKEGLAEGLSNRQIAEKLGVSHMTVNRYVKQMQMEQEVQHTEQA